MMDVMVPSSLPGGVYCDVISGGLEGGLCTGREVYVDVIGYARVVIDSSEEDPMIAIHIGVIGLHIGMIGTHIGMIGLHICMIGIHISMTSIHIGMIGRYRG